MVFCSDDERGLLGTLPTGHGAPDAAARIGQNSTRKCPQHVDERELRIIVYFGLDGNEALTLEKSVT